MKIYVPNPEATLSWGYLARGSAIVGAGPYTTDRVLVYYEGNVYKAMNIKTWADRLHHAAGRARTNYPTVAKCAPQLKDVLEVGELLDDGTIVITDRDRLQQYLGCEDLDKELMYS